MSKKEVSKMSKKEVSKMSKEIKQFLIEILKEIPMSFFEGAPIIGYTTNENISTIIVYIKDSPRVMFGYGALNNLSAKAIIKESIKNQLMLLINLNSFQTQSSPLYNITKEEIMGSNNE